MEITGKTKLTGLIGTPVAHSVSPQMHNEAFRQLNLDYVYLAFDLANTDLGTAVHGLQAIGAKGFNVTMPYKVQILEYMDELTPAATIAQACNTVIAKDGKLIGHTTDGIGFMESVADAGHNIIGKKMTLLGAGGAATAIASQAALDGVSEINIFSRKTKFWDRAGRLADTLNSRTDCKVSLYELADTTSLKASLKDSAILTNGTSVGMAPDMEHSLITEPEFFHEGLIVSDVIYNPRETMLMKLARENGCHTFNGLYMLYYQGAEAFRLWTGMEMPEKEIKEKFFQP